MITLMASVKPSVLSGLFASIAVIMGTFFIAPFFPSLVLSSFPKIAKLAFDASESSILKRFTHTHFEGFQYFLALLWTFRAIFGLLAIVSNALMLKYYVASLKLNGATKATVYTFSCNFILTVCLIFFLTTQVTILGHNWLNAVRGTSVTSLGFCCSCYDDWCHHASEEQVEYRSSARPGRCAHSSASN